MHLPLHFPPKETLRAWWKASRPPFYIATLVPLLTGFIAAGKDTGQWSVGLFTLVLLACFLLHLAANLGNDYFDHLSGVDRADTLGGSRALQDGMISLPEYKKVLKYLYSATLALAFLGVLATGRWHIWSIVLFAMFASYFYVAPPVRYGYRALGEVFVFLSMGVVMTVGTYYTLTGVWSFRLLALSIPIGLMVAGILYFQSLPEIETDLASGKHTLANTVGAPQARIIFRLWWPLTWGILLLLWMGGACAWPVLLGIAGAAPFHAQACRHVDEALYTGDWPALDSQGRLVRAMYMLGGVGLIGGVALR